MNKRKKAKVNNVKTVSSMIREAIEGNGFKDVKECARSINVPYDLFNKVVGGHIPKDAQLMDYARKLKIDSRELILAAYREKAPDDMKQYFNSVQLLEEHNEQVQGIVEILDDCNTDQLSELLQIAKLIRSSSREYCRKALSLVTLYQQMDEDVIGHFDALVLLALRNNNLPGLKGFETAVEKNRKAATGRRKRLLV